MTYVYTVYISSNKGVVCMYRYEEDIYNTLRNISSYSGQQYECSFYNGHYWESTYTGLLANNEELMTEDKVKRIIIEWELSK